VIREKSRCGLFFSDNSVYENGIPKLSGESTESCQYYAFFTGIATPEEDAELWSVLLDKFGPKRDRETVYPEVSPSNAFIGNYLRCEILRRYGLREKLSEDIIDYFLYMAERTGTLWENDTTTASCNHGFASHVLVWLDYLGYLE
jgi:alpha-L-rhamnosidase